LDNVYVLTTTQLGVPCIVVLTTLALLCVRARVHVWPLNIINLHLLCCGLIMPVWIFYFWCRHSCKC